MAEDDGLPNEDLPPFDLKQSLGSLNCKDMCLLVPNGCIKIFEAKEIVLRQPSAPAEQTKCCTCTIF